MSLRADNVPKQANKKWKLWKFLPKSRKALSDDLDEDFIPEVRRRFVFDDTALRSGGTMKELFVAEEPPEEDFNDIVDQDDRRIEVFVSQELVGQLIESIYFRIFIIGLIVINSILIGLATDEQLSIDYRYMFSIFDQVVMATFVCELLLKWYYGFWIFFRVGWNVLDFIIIVALVLGPQLSFLSSSRILRILRVLRAFRSLRSISAFAGLSMVVQTILQSIPDMTNICLLLCIILLVLGVSGVTLFNTHIPEKFGDLESAMFSLFICVTQDGWVEMFQLFQGKGNLLHIGGAIYFIISIIIGAFVFANLVVAVVVTNLEMAMKELKKEKKAQVDTLTIKEEGQRSEDTDAEDRAEAVPVVSHKTFQKKVDVTKQAPLLKTEMRALNTEKLEKYFLVLLALEENLAEYSHIRHDLNKLYEMVYHLNAADDDQMATNFNQSGHSMPKSKSNLDMEELKKGDILSNLIKLEEQQKVSSKAAQNMDDVVRSAFH